MAPNIAITHYGPGTTGRQFVPQSSSRKVLSFIYLFFLKGFAGYEGLKSTNKQTSSPGVRGLFLYER